MIVGAANDPRLSKEFLHELDSFTEGLWQDSGAWPDLISGMRQAMKIQVNNYASGQVISRWAFLPYLCCESIGESPDGLIELTAAWLLLYAAADLMDAVQDQEIEHSWWGEIGIGGTLGVASGLYFSSSLALIRLEEGPLITAQLTDLEEEGVEVGMPVEMVTRKLRSTTDERGLLVYGYKFRPLLQGE